MCCGPAGCCPSCGPPCGGPYCKPCCVEMCFSPFTPAYLQCSYCCGC
ncbi:male-specific sperm protein Mst84Dd [Drosophila nasuta]|nr:male-specific sperm protein Mst84Dd [Drosophila nasuta]XP_060654390.1 male-specific sperm protein Mst84Dd [Drosophila nasuta]XP_060654399.1 male-specific sperm protein Mst84Dd [Drosophila nasuta]